MATSPRTGSAATCSPPVSRPAQIAVPGGAPVSFNTAALEQIKKAIEDTSVNSLNFGWPPKEHPDRATPYRGWEPFEDIDAGVFFGRDAAIAQGWVLTVSLDDDHRGPVRH